MAVDKAGGIPQALGALAILSDLNDRGSSQMVGILRNTVETGAVLHIGIVELDSHKGLEGVALLLQHIAEIIAVAIVLTAPAVAPCDVYLLGPIFLPLVTMNACGMPVDMAAHDLFTLHCAYRTLDSGMQIRHFSQPSFL